MNRYNSWKDKTPVRPFLKPEQKRIEERTAYKLWAITMVSIMITAMIYILVESIQ